MSKFYISIPYSVNLCSEKNWERLDEKNTKFCIVRFHFMLRNREVDEKTKWGEKLAVHEAPIGVEIKKVISIEQERLITNTEKSIETCLQEDETTYEFALTLASKINASPVLSLSPDIKASCVDKFKSTFQKSFCIEKAVAEKTNVKFELTYTINSEATEKYVSVVSYQKYSLDLYLAYVDYLFVDYQKTLMGLRKKRYKNPPALSRMHDNIIKFNTPLASMHYWKLLQSATMVDEKEYKNQVDDPEEIIVKEPDSNHKYQVTMPDVPTLYQISNVAFPLKWIKRKGDWTEEELKNIEWEDAEGTAWWFNYGPGRK